MAEPESIAPIKEDATLSQKSHGQEIRALFAPSTSAVTPLTSPLLSSTPPTVSKALIKAYPYLLIANKCLSVATWTNDDHWVNVILMCVYGFVVLYLEWLITWLGHVILVMLVILYAVLHNHITQEANVRPTLDDVIQALTTTCIKADLLLSPVTNLALTPYDIKRLLFTTIFLTPLYLVATFFIISPRTILLVAGLFLLSYHLTYSRVTRKLIWKLKIARIICFYLTGLDFSHARNSSLFAAAFAKVQKLASSSAPAETDLTKPVRFTYVIYENQRRWLGIGWTSNLLTYERAPWTDEFLNESTSIENFELPNADSSSIHQHQFVQHPQLSDVHWRWVDKAWRLDITNDGAITLPAGKRSKTTANPSTDEGYIYYDNTWKKPSTEDSYSKYTRRRRWIRTAELVIGSQTKINSGASSLNAKGELESSSVKKRKSLRFAEDSSLVPDVDTEDALPDKKKD